MTAAVDKPLLTFPCAYVLKVVATAHTVTLVELLAIIQPHVPTLLAENITVKNSSQDKYTSFSVAFTAESQLQLDALYHELTARNGIVFVL